ncbi:MAG TPA: pteridine reductase [Steroidobacteraceae bacterium]|nr:pteridine reductase [Steroidobacteraceae bacterium]
MAHSPAGSAGPLSGKTAFVTGSARRIGAELARTLHGAGASVVLHYRTLAREADELARALNALRSGSAAVVHGDLNETARIAPLVAAAAAAFGRLDILVNNASSFYPTPLGQVTERAWDDLVGSNLKAPLFLAQAAARELIATRGLVLNLVDIHGMRPLPRYPVYSVAKAGLIMLTKALARELAPHVRVNAIAPGPVMWPDAAEEELQAEIVARTLLKRPGSPQDVARAALFFAADAPYVTGQTLAVDGGRSVCW